MNSRALKPAPTPKTVALLTLNVIRLSRLNVIMHGPKLVNSVEAVKVFRETAETRHRAAMQLPLTLFLSFVVCCDLFRYFNNDILFFVDFGGNLSLDIEKNCLT